MSYVASMLFSIIMIVVASAVFIWSFVCEKKRDKRNQKKENEEE